MIASSPNLAQCFEEALRNWSGDSSDFTEAVERGVSGCGVLLAREYGIDEDVLRLSSRSMDGEFLVDFAWTTYPPDLSLLDAPGDTPYEIVMALESEQGRMDNPRLNCRNVLQGFQKLLPLKARVKIMAYRFHADDSEYDADRFLDRFERIVTRQGGEAGNERWIFIGVPWEAQRRRELAISEVLAGAEGETRVTVPNEVPRYLGMSPSELEREVHIMLAARLYQRGLFSTGGAAELLQVPRTVLLNRLGDFDVPMSDLSEEEVQEAMRNAGRSR